MGFFDRFRGGGKADAPPDVITICDETVARAMPRPPAANFSDAPEPPCDGCGKPLTEMFITTGGPASDPAIWRDHPIAVDAWACVACGQFRYPRCVSADQIHGWMEDGVRLGRDGQFEEAEQCFVRVVWDWPGYAPGHFNLAEATRSRLHATGDALDAPAARRLEQRMLEHSVLGFAAYEAQPHPSQLEAVARAHLTVAEAALRSAAHERAQRELARLLALGDVPAEIADRARDLVRYSEQRLDLFERAAAVLSPRIELMDQPSAPAETGDERKAIADAITDLEEHLRHAPDRWQSMWLYAKSLFLIDRSADGFAAWERAWQRHPDRTEIATDYSSDLLRAEQIDRALEVNRAIAERHPEEARLWSNLAVSEMLTGDIAAAEASIARGRALDPDDPVAITVEHRLQRGAPFPTTFRDLTQGG